MPCKSRRFYDRCLVHDGDWVIIRHQNTAQPRDMIVAWIKDREETTLKHYFPEGEMVRLQPANPAYQPIPCPPASWRSRARSSPFSASWRDLPFRHPKRCASGVCLSGLTTPHLVHRLRFDYTRLMIRLPRACFERDSATVARALLGQRVVRVLDGQRVGGLICETEAYGGADDQASHAYRRTRAAPSCMARPATPTSTSSTACTSA